MDLNKILEEKETQLKRVEIAYHQLLGQIELLKDLIKNNTK